MRWNKLNYMLDNNPEVTLSKKGSDIRKLIRPAFTKILSIGNKLDLHIEQKKFDKNQTNRPIIYVCSHGFKDDVLNTLLTIKDDTYIVAGNIDLFYHTFDGLCLWIYGTQLVDRFSAESKKAAKEKMNAIIKAGNNIIIFPEATWNLSPNNLMEKFHGGFYDTALENDALVVPVITYKVGNNCYSSMLEAVDVADLLEDDKNEIIRKIVKYLNMAIDSLYNYPSVCDNVSIMSEITELTMLLEHEHDKTQIEKIISEIELKAKKIKNQMLEKQQGDLNEDAQLVRKYIITCISKISHVRKEVVVDKIRDMMATEKMRMYEEHPDITYDSADKTIYESWEDYKRDVINGTPYFYPEPEHQTLYRDPLISEPENVFKIYGKKSVLKLVKKSR